MTKSSYKICNDIFRSKQKIDKTEFLLVWQGLSDSRIQNMDAYLAPWVSLRKNESILISITLPRLIELTDLVIYSRCRSVTIDECQSDPYLLLECIKAAEDNKLLDLGGNTKPFHVLDKFFLLHGWWDENSPKRKGILVLEAVREDMKEHEYIRYNEDYINTVLRKLRIKEDEVSDLFNTKLKKLDVNGETVVAFRSMLNTVKKVRDCLENHDGVPELKFAPPANLTDEQEAVFRAVMRRKYTLTTAPAGSGKTHVASAVTDIFPSEFALCIAPTHKAVSVLASRLGRGCFKTLQSIVSEIRHTQFAWANPPALKIIILDELSMAGMYDVSVLLQQFQDDPSVRFLFLGDGHQLPCVGGGDCIGDLALLLPSMCFPLTRIMRTNAPSLVQLATLVRSSGMVGARDGFRDENLEIRKTRSTLTDKSSVSECMQTLDITPDICQDPSSPEFHPIITFRNKEVRVINRAVQRMLCRQPREAFGDCYAGDPVCFVETRVGYQNGEEGVVVKVERGHRLEAVVRKTDGSVVTLGANAVYHIKPMFACTVHKCQGSEYSRSTFYIADHDPGKTKYLLSSKLVYTAVTRAKQKLHIVGAVERLRTLAIEPRRTLVSTNLV